jgi:hypothetical protein
MMDAARFDRLTRSLSAWSSRRRLLHLAAASVGLGLTTSPLVVGTRAKKKKLKKNAFGCVNVGNKCRGKNGQCCSGVCKGDKPKKDEKDKSECKAHDTGSGCVAGQQSEFCAFGGLVKMGLGSEGGPQCTTSAGLPGECETTTGNAPYCVADGLCFACHKDADCQSSSVCGPGAACIRCVGCEEEGGTACVAPSKNACGLPPVVLP